ncbi:MAG: sensor histidine kinase KdpD [Eubacteriales bacterium]
MIYEKKTDWYTTSSNLNGQKRGRMTVFLGVSAGAGKTYAMLDAARERLAEGVDVVVGWVDTYGRMETEALLKGLPALARRRLVYRDKEFEEIDLNAILDRRPALVLVGNLAHNNIPGSRHTHRYQDVEELLAAGVNVYTTINIQHIETLNDIVTRITGVAVKETVPDKFLESAFQIQLVDIPPEELIQRLKDGKVYVPGQDEEALRRFYRPGNINALRELALRYTAKRVGHTLETYMEDHRIEGPWPTGDRIMVCVSPSPFSAQLIRMAKRTAEGMKAEWLAVYVETPRRFPPNEAERDLLARNLQLAVDLGAETITLTGNDIAGELLELAKKRNVSQILIGKSLHTAFWEWTRSSVADNLTHRSSGVGIYVIPNKPKPEKQKKLHFPTLRIPLINYLLPLMTMALVTILAGLVYPYVGLANVAMLLILPILFSAVKWGTGPAVAAAVVCSLTFDYFYIPPVLGFIPADLPYLLSLVVFIIVALLTGTLSGRLQQQVISSRQRETRMAALYSLSRDIAAVSEINPAMEIVARRISETTDSQVAVLLLDQSGKLELRAGASSQDFLNDSELAAAEWSFENGEIAGRGTETLSSAVGLYVPLRTEQYSQGVLGIKLESKEQRLQLEQRRLLEAFANLTSLLVTRIKLAELARESHLVAESERLRTALFDSLSHDLRTPLASIIGAVTSLLEGEGFFSPEASYDLLQTIKQGALRMNRFVGNLLDMAELESGLIRLNKDWCDIREIIGVAVRDMKDLLRDRPLRVKVSPDLPLVKVDFVVLEQVLVNLLDNAIKYSDTGSEICISASYDNKQVKITVTDNGQGIPTGDLDHVFDKFYRLKSPRQVSGTGLGLAICKGLIETHEGSIWASNNPSGGLDVSFILPLGEAVPNNPSCIYGEENNDH